LICWHGTAAIQIAHQAVQPRVAVFIRRARPFQREQVAAANAPVLSLTQKNVLSLCAASKTFNLAGLEQAAMLVPDEAVSA